MFVITYNKKTPKSPRRHSCLHLLWCQTMADCLQLTRGGAVIKRPCQSTVEGGACAAVRHFAENMWSVNSLIWENAYEMITKKINTGWICISIGCMCTHTLPAHVQTPCKRTLCLMSHLRQSPHIHGYFYKQFFLPFKKKLSPSTWKHKCMLWGTVKSTLNQQVTI